MAGRSSNAARRISAPAPTRLWRRKHRRLLGLPLERVTAELGDTVLPQAPVSGGSQSAASVIPAVRSACLALRDQLFELAGSDPASPLHGASPGDLTLADGRIIHGAESGRAEPYAAILKRQGREMLTAEGSAKPGEEKQHFSMHSFGAHFVELSVDPELGEIRVRRHVGAFAAGRILNLKTARSQMIGGIVFGIGMALMEASAAAIANAVYHATGLRIRDLPIRPDKLIEGLSA
jgi:xanthine dehydrogenase YagR molybdenum-binding subunit